MLYLKTSSTVCKVVDLAMRNDTNEGGEEAALALTLLARILISTKVGLSSS